MPHTTPQLRSPVDTPLFPVLTALESAQTLRWEVDGLDVTDYAEVSRVRHEVAMLRHWLQQSRDCGEYSALLDGLRSFADQVDRQLADS
ncbi:hypothetical protein GCM10011581_39550 [Saccharopolyspora subtropica]|uniref:Uncharacterized protein n=1 Tax=Saccharopolyspora thermophila TaxID=89367 RepID=A0A917NHI0_9PSEU|nr:hypothetical protein [Saccharopolyspora subtropica]GGI98467.1 hypothetical protein GCM10011581_39550 [Saccharopolyspora subtropica]